jgi:hypothetical protein
MYHLEKYQESLASLDEVRTDKFPGFCPKLSDFVWFSRLLSWIPTIGQP